MKIKVLIGMLAISVLMNIAGIVFFILFLKVQGSYRTVSRERNLLQQNLTVIRSNGAVEAGLQTERFYKRAFVSLADGQEDMFALQPPTDSSRRDNVLIVYLHGMGSNYLEPFIYPAGEPVAQAIASQRSNICLLSCNYRKDASWGTDLAMSDISQNIREVTQQYPVDSIVLIGTSMGGCTVLTYATQAPPDIKGKIKGIVTVEGAGSLKDLCALSKNQSVPVAIAGALGGTYKQVPQMYDRKSFIPNIAALPPGVRVAVVSAKQDKIVPPRLQRELVDALEKDHRPVQLLEIASEHGVPPGAVYVQGLTFALNGR